MNIKLLSSRSVLVLLFALLPLSFFAQQSSYDWSWAVRGGGSQDLVQGSLPSVEHMQRIQNISIDSHNNYYFLAQIGGESSLGSAPTFGNVPNDTIAINDYSDLNSERRNTYLVSTNCQGDFRWHKSIGGTGDIYAFGVGTDDLGGVYIAGNAGQPPLNSGIPLHFDQDSIKNSLNKDKLIYLIKYDTLGNFQWLKEPQPDLSDPGWGTATGGEIYVEEDGTVHWMVTLDPGSTLENGAVVAEDNYFAPTDSQVGDLGILKYDKDGNFISYTRLDIEMYQHMSMNLYREIKFTYDPVYQQYYMTAFSNRGNTNHHPAIINGIQVSGAVYLAAFDATTGNSLWWHQFSENEGGTLRKLATDNLGNLYVTGTFIAIITNGQISGYPSFAGITFDHGILEPFCIKMDHNGQGLWASNPDEGLGRGESITVNDDGVFLGLGYGTYGGGGHYWDSVYFERPSGNGLDPVVVHLDKDSGEAIEIYDITSPGYGYNDEVTSVTTDKLGNIVVGGYMRSAYLFEDHPTVPQMNKKQSNPSDFFIAQLNKDGVSCDDEILEVSEVTKPVIQVWPNPTQGKLHINGDKPIDAIEIYNVLGQKVDVQFATGVETNSIITNVSSLNSGVYFVKVYSLEDQQTFRVIKN